ncbi:hypothetical protein LguiB_009206 [Lonicera macranthoides]
METPHLPNTCRTLPFLNSLHLFFINLNPLCTYNKTKKYKLIRAKGALFQVSI